MTPERSAGRSPLVFIFLTVFIDLLGFGIVIPLLPIYSKAYDASELELGLLFAAFSGMQFVFAPMWGRVSDRIGRKPVLVGGLIGTGASYLVFANAPSLAWLFAARFLGGFFGANISTAQAYIADVTTPENRAKGMGLIGAAFGLGFTFGPFFGGELTAWSPSAPGYCAALLSFCAATFGFFVLHEPDRSQRAPARRYGRFELVYALRHGRLGTLLLLSFLFVFSFSAFESMFARFGLARFPDVFHVPARIEHATMDQMLAAAPIVGRYLMVIGILSAIIQGGLIRRLLPRFGETKLAIAGPFFLALSFVIVAFASSWGMVIIGCALMPIGFGLNNPALNGLISRASPADEQGAYLGLNQSALSLARMTGPPCAGALFQAFGPSAPFWFGGGVLFTCTVIAWRYRTRYGATFPRGAAAPSTAPG
ncbi:MAG: MFS transporter [Planctomycetota bacterium]